MKMTAEIMRFLRVSKDMSQAEFAKHIGCNRSLIGRIESGERALTERTAKKIQDSFEVTADRIEEIAKFIGK